MVVTNPHFSTYTSGIGSSDETQITEPFGPGSSEDKKEAPPTGISPNLLRKTGKHVFSAGCRRSLS